MKTILIIAVCTYLFCLFAIITAIRVAGKKPKEVPKRKIDIDVDVWFEEYHLQ